MTMQRRLLLAAIAAVVALGLAWYGYVANWPDKFVGIFAGMGTGFLILVAVMRFAPRWWREQCEEQYASRANRDYRRQMWPAMLVYVLAVFASTWLLKNSVQLLPLRALIAAAPALPIFFVMRAFLRYLRSIDEMQRRIEMEAIGVAALFVSQLYLLGGFLQLGKVIDVPSGVAMIWVFPLMCLSYGIGKFIAVRRYR
ncbi:hypothetical protein [Solilutibacter silvestris]|uniref:Transmembrane protein n=1 Tax=Solilutibacter silvestris TaxID=1645665 RepID=A0A2K1Q126_9GAMM|nr:hypothetical protein [Lysobacter silvestris]PNS08748.1 hypothetical protein Lysil_0377 [Lysobacter silvestris]